MSLYQLSEAEIGFFNDLDTLVCELSAHSQQVEVENTDPRCVSLMLHNRLISNYRGFVLLWRGGRLLEAAIILRSAIEAAICISANFVMREAFYPLLLGDLVATLKGQIKRWREDAMETLVREGEAHLRAVAPKAPEKPRRFDWEARADRGGQPKLYGFHKDLSMISSHVTALSLMRGVVGADGAGADLQEKWEALERPKLIRQMAGALMVGLKLHAEIIEAGEFLAQANALEDRLVELSEGWTEE